MAVREELLLDLSQALRQVDDLERQLDGLLQPIRIPVDVEADQALAQLRQEIALTDADSIDVDVDSTDLNRAERELEEMRRESDRTEESIDDLGDQARRSADEVEGLGQRGQRAFTGLRSNISGLLTGVAAFAGATEIFQFFSRSITAASDLEESLSKTRVVFGDFSDDIETFASTAPDALLLSEQAALEATSTFGNLFTALGLSRQAAADLSPEIVQLGADLASFNNIAVDDALTALRSGLVGEVEPLRRLGVAINAAAVEAKALELGLADSSGEVSEAAKVQARYALILEQTTNAQEDVARTADSIANRQRALSASFQDLQADVGQALVPAFEALLESGQGLVPVIEDLIPLLGLFGQGIQDIVEPAGALVDALASVGDIIRPIEQAFGGVAGSDAPSFFDDVREVTLNTLNPLRQLDDILNEVNLRFETGLGVGEVRDEFDQLASSIELGVDPAEALRTAFERLAAEGTVTESLLDQLIQAAGDLEDVDLADFLTSLDFSDLDDEEIDAVRAALADLRSGLGAATTARESFERATGQIQGIDSFEIALEDINAGLARLQFERATGQLDEFKDEFADFDTSILFDIETPNLESQIADIEDSIGQLPDALSAARAALKDEENEIVDDFGEFFESLDEELAAREQFAQNLEILRSLGFDDLAAQFEQLGLDSAAALADGLANPQELAAAEARLEAFNRSITQSFATEIAAAVSEGTSSIDELIAKIAEVEGLTSTARIQVLFEAVGAIDSRGVFESNIATGTLPATPTPTSNETNITVNIESTQDPAVDAARTAQAVSSVLGTGPR